MVEIISPWVNDWNSENVELLISASLVYFMLSERYIYMEIKPVFCSSEILAFVLEKIITLRMQSCLWQVRVYWYISIRNMYLDKNCTLSQSVQY